MAALQPTCALPSFPEIPGVCFAHVPNWTGYAASDDGHAWSCHLMGRDATGKIVKSYGPWRRMAEQLTDNGYYVTYVTQNGKRRRARIHILVLEAFVGTCPPGMEACHDPDRTRTNNRLENLRWATRANNHADRIAHGTANRGTRHGMAKLNESSAIAIASSTDSDRDLSVKFGVSLSAVRAVRNGFTWSHVTGIAPNIPVLMHKSSTVAFLDALRIIGPAVLDDIASVIPLSRNTVKNAATDLVRFGILHRDDENRLYFKASVQPTEWSRDRVTEPTKQPTAE